ncbi:MAG: Tn3 family transposase [Chromatiaceae bacterium]|nr:Tn3 family transposase [Chromatiaceae bacterium]
MPVDFLTEAQKRRYGRYPEEVSAVQLARYFHVDDTARDLIAQRRGDANRLGFVLQLLTVRFLGTFLPNPTEVPVVVVAHVARQLAIADVGCLVRYLDREPTRHEHRAEIRAVYGYQDFGPRWSFRLTRWLYLRAWFGNERPSLLFDQATAWLIERKVLLPGVTTLSRLVASVRERTATRLWRSLAALPDAEQQAQLETLLEIPQGTRYSRLDSLRRGPTRVSAPALLAALRRHADLKAMGIGTLDFSGIPPVRLQALARHAATAWAPTIARMPRQRRIATLVAFVAVQEISALDDALDVLDMLITEIAAQAKRLGQKQRLRTLRDLDQAALALSEACAILLDPAGSGQDVREAIFERVPEARMRQAIETVHALARPAEDNYQQELVERYRRVRHFLPTVLQQVRFAATPSGQPAMDALAFLCAIEGKRAPDLSEAPLEIVTKPWRRLVLPKGGGVDRPAYTLCALERVQDSLRRRDLYVTPSERWGDPRVKLLQGAQWEGARGRICRSLNLPLDPDQAIGRLREQLDLAYRCTLDHLPENEAVSIDEAAEDRPLRLSNLDKIDEPASLIALREHVLERLPRIDLPEILLEIHLRTGFADAFTHISESQSRVEDLAISVCAVLLAEACNIGLEPLVRGDNPALTRNRLSWVQQNYVRAETLIEANARLVECQTANALAREWGGGEVASADGMRFVTPVQTIHAGPNRKYFGAGRGITYYNFSSDQYAGFHNIVIPGTLRDSIYILAGLLEQQTSLQPQEIMADTAGASDVMFGLFWLLGYQFSPRLADVGGTRFWRIDREADYGMLNGLSKHQINIERIARHWEDILRVAGSLKLGTIGAPELVRSLLKSDRPSSLTKAIGDLGRIPKTIHLLTYLDDESYRRRILVQLNRGEGRHAVARKICHGQRGEIRKRYREGQENQLNALGLVTNAVILWNTLYIEAALEQLRAEGLEVRPEDVARLSPLPTLHINVLGRYSFLLAEAVAAGGMRPLRNPEADDDWLLA